MKQTTILLLTVAVIVTVITRFTTITWGQPFFFHPDERNIASSVAQLRIPQNLNPHFFAYGSLPLYVIFSIGLVINFFSSCHLLVLRSFSEGGSLITCLSSEALVKTNHVSFEQALIISRILSALFSCLSLILMYLIAQRVWTKRTAVLISLLGVFCTGFIQFSHFGTYEMWSVCFSLLLCFLCLKKLHGLSLYSLEIGGVTGILIAIKLSNVVFLPLGLLAISLAVKAMYHKQAPLIVFARKLLKYSLLFLLTILFVYLLTNPFVILSQQEFFNSFVYEKTVATGELSVFYTQEFFGTIPVLYQLFHVFPFLLNPVITLLLPAVIITTGRLIKKTKKIEYIILGLFFFVSFFPQAILFIKWTRNSVITLPYIFLLLPVLAPLIRQKFIRNIAMGIVLGSSVFFSLSYFSLVFLQEDTRTQAARQAQQLLPENTIIMSEVYDLGIVPFNTHFPNITLANTYDMEHDRTHFMSFEEQLQNSSVIILPSQRVIKTRMSNPTRFPKGYSFYNRLLNSTEYKKIYETPCSLLCNIVYLGNPLGRFELTASVFDRPIVQIYKKI